MSAELPSSLNVFVVNDDPAVGHALRGLLGPAGYRVEAFDRPEALLSRLSPGDRGCLVLDLDMPSAKGLALQRSLLELGVTLPSIFVNGRSQLMVVASAMKRSMVDIVSQSAEPDSLLAVVERALKTDAELASKRHARERARERWAELSPREKQVCRLTASGLLNKQISAELRTAESTVQAQRSRALKKLEVGSVVELVRLIALASDDS